MSTELARIKGLLVEFEEDELLETVKTCLSIRVHRRSTLAWHGRSRERLAAGDFFVNERTWG